MEAPTLHRDPRSGEFDLIDRCLRSDAGAWTDFVAAYKPLLAKLVRDELKRKTGRAGAADVDDLVENVLLNLLENNYAALRAYDPRYCFSTWLGVLSRTAVHRLLRKKRPIPSPLADLPMTACRQDGPVAIAERGEAVQAVREATESLGSRDRLLLALFYFESADYKLISRVTGLRMNSVGPALFRARARLKQELEARGVRC